MDHKWEIDFSRRSTHTKNPVGTSSACYLLGVDNSVLLIFLPFSTILEIFNHLNYNPAPVRPVLVNDLRRITNKF